MKTLYAGPVKAGYEQGFLRRITYGGTEILRMIYFALRDHNWNTISGEINNETIAVNDSSFQIAYEYANTDGGVTVMEWKANIEGRSDGTITFEIHGTVTADFRRNRAGFCVLHPLNLMGVDVKITHPDNSQRTRSFPVEVDPENPFRNIRSMEWSASGTPFAIDFEGDLFETEDQRNWSDASYKTFCTPLDKPFPVELHRGDKIFQRVTFKPLVTLATPVTPDAFISLMPGTRSVFPSLGVAASTEVKALSPQAADLIRSLNLRHYRVDVYPGNEGWVTDFSGAYEIGFGLGTSLEVVLHLTEKYVEEIEAFVVLCLQNKVKLRKILLLQVNSLVTGQEIIDQVPAIKAAFPRVPVGAGTNYNFNEINKNRFTSAGPDYISFSIDPQEHAFDDLTILENIETQEHLVTSAKAIYGGAMPVHVSPITLRKRFNPYATNPADLYIPESAKADPRQKKPFAALWIFGSLCSLSKGGAAAVTCCQTAGDQGILSGEGEPYPVYDVLKSLSPWQGRQVEVLESSDPLAVQAMALDGKFLALANLTQQEQMVRHDETEFALRPLEIMFRPLHRS